MELKKKKQELEAEMKRITISNCQSRWYFQKKSEGISKYSKLNVSGSSTSSKPLSPLASSDIASFNKSTIGSESSSLHLVVSESLCLDPARSPVHEQDPCLLCLDPARSPVHEQDLYLLCLVLPRSPI